MDPNLVKYITDALNSGQTKEQVRASLLQAGWEATPVDEALNSFSQSQTSNQSTSTTPSPFDQQLFSTTNNFYPSIIIERNPHPNRFYAFPLIGGLFKIIICLPVFLIAGIIYIAVTIELLVNAFYVLFTGTYFDTTYKYALGYMRYQTKIAFFFSGLTDKYPGFSWDIADTFRVDMAKPLHPNRFFAIPLVGMLARAILLIPLAIFQYIVITGTNVGTVLNSFFVLFTGQYSESIFELQRDSIRLTLAIQAFQFGLSDTYPSFSISWNHKVKKIILLIIGVCWFALGLIGQVKNVAHTVQTGTAQANNAARSSAVYNLFTAVGEYQADNHGQLPEGIPTQSTEIAKNGVDLCATLVTHYMASLPIDPIYPDTNGVTDCTNNYHTGYFIQAEKPDQNGIQSIIVTAPHAQNGATISSQPK